MEQSELFQTAVQKAKAGERDQAQEMLLKLVEKEPNHELAWLWLTNTTKTVASVWLIWVMARPTKVRYTKLTTWLPSGNCR